MNFQLWKIPIRSCTAYCRLHLGLQRPVFGAVRAQPLNFLKKSQLSTSSESSKMGRLGSLHVPYSVLLVGGAVLGYSVVQRHDLEAVVMSEGDQEAEEVQPDIAGTSVRDKRLRGAIAEARDLAQRIKDEVGCPGLVVAVTVDGKEVWKEGLGYSDVENRVLCKPDTVMRIASISKPITMTAVARLWEADKLDIDKPVREYVPTWPEQTFNGQKVEVTTRQLVSHLSGIRHYEKDCGKKRKQKKAAATKAEKEAQNTKDKDQSKKDKEEDREAHVRSELEMQEYYIKDKYKSVTSSISLFKDDPLCSLPGTEYLYTTHGWTLVSAVVEGAAKTPFDKYIQRLFVELGLKNTYLDDNEPLIYNRSRYYIKNKQGKIQNAPYVDNSYKYAGGGFISTASDLCRFGNAMLYSYQHSGSKGGMNKPGILKQSTVKKMWTQVKNTECFWNPDGSYGMGWCVVPYKHKHGACREQRFMVNHTGAAIGASSALLVLPRQDSSEAGSHPSGTLPAGVVVAMICNIQNAGLNKTAEHIAYLFDEL